MTPFEISGPAQISFSGGRSSGMLLCKIVEAHGGTLPGDVFVLFANTGKEREETLEFVYKIQQHLGVPIHWLEYCEDADSKFDRWAEVNIRTASRRGEPFRAAVLKERRLPNSFARVCTRNLKIIPMQGFMRRYGFGDDEYQTIVGIRADEPRRVAKLRDRNDTDFRMPLVEAGVTKADVWTFWNKMPFDLALAHSGESNCDLCYLKGQNTLISLIRENPRRADWWIEMEDETGNLFRGDRPNYAALKIIAMRPQLWDQKLFDSEDALPCECVD